MTPMELEAKHSDEAHAECEQCHPHRRLAGEIVVEMRDVHVTIQGNSVLRGVTLKIPRGEIVALIGPNGSGKTTLLRCLLGLQRVDRGDILLFGRESSGVPDHVHDLADASLVIPMRGGGRSLNLALSAAMAAGEALRQLRGPVS